MTGNTRLAAWGIALLASTLSFIIAAFQVALASNGAHVTAIAVAIAAATATSSAGVAIWANLYTKRIIDSRQVFIIHSRQDVEQARRLSAILTTAGFKPWIAEEQIGAGSDFQEVIKKAQEQSPATIVLVSENLDIESPWVAAELAVAMRNSASRDSSVSPVIPVSVDTTPVPRGAFSAQGVQLDNPGASEELVSALRRVYGLTQQTHAQR